MLKRTTVLADDHALKHKWYIQLMYSNNTYDSLIEGKAILLQ